MLMSLIGIIVITGLAFVCDATVQCDFNDGSLCQDWNQGIDDIIDEFDWSVGFSRGQLSESDNNSTNITQIGDYFFYMATTDRSPNHRAVFASPVMTSPDGHVNITFLFCMFGDHTQSLSVFIKDMSLVSYESEIWSRDGKDADVWTSVTEHANVTGPFRVIFQGKVGKGSAAIAVDDILIDNADILTQDKTPSPPPSLENTNLTTSTTLTTSLRHDVVTRTTQITTTAPGLFDLETVPLIIAASGGVVFWIGVLLLITFFTCRKSRKSKNRVSQEGNNINKKLSTISSKNDALDVKYVPEHSKEVRIYKVPDHVTHDDYRSQDQIYMENYLAPDPVCRSYRPPDQLGVEKDPPIYNNQIPCVFNYDALTSDTDTSQPRYAHCSPIHDYATIS